MSAFDITWRDIQISATFGGVGTTLNGGRARSSGVEWNLTGRPVAGLLLGFNGAYTRARLTEDLPASVNGHDGDRLPGSPRWSTAFSATYEHALTNTLDGLVGLEWRYAGARAGEFTATGPRQRMPAYDMVDLRAGVAASGWSLTAFVKNVGDELAVSSVASKTLAGEFGPQMANIYAPRTYGLTLSAEF